MKDAKQCSRMAGDIRRVGALAAELGSGKIGLGPQRIGNRGGIRSSVFGPPGHEIIYDYHCSRPQEAGDFGPGTCAVIEIERSGPGAAKLRKRASVGNLFGLMEQLSRDIARAWGCTPEPTSGFEGARRRKRR